MFLNKYSLRFDSFCSLEVFFFDFWDCFFSFVLVPFERFDYCENIELILFFCMPVMWSIGYLPMHSLFFLDEKVRRYLP